MNKANCINSGHVITFTTPFLTIGGKKYYPLEGGTAYRYW